MSRWFPNSFFLLIALVSCGESYEQMCVRQLAHYPFSVGEYAMANPNGVPDRWVTDFSECWDEDSSSPCNLVQGVTVRRTKNEVEWTTQSGAAVTSYGTFEFEGLVEDRKIVFVRASSVASWNTNLHAEENTGPIGATSETD